MGIKADIHSGRSVWKYLCNFVKLSHSIFLKIYTASMLIPLNTIVYSAHLRILGTRSSCCVSYDKTDGSHSLGKIMWEKRHWRLLWNVVRFFFINTFLIYHSPHFFLVQLDFWHLLIDRQNQWNFSVCADIKLAIFHATTLCSIWLNGKYQTLP